jgi:NADH-quinone oxidoreductase subunit M
MNDLARDIPLLSLLVVVPTLAALVLAVVPGTAVKALRWIAGVATGLTTLFAVILVMGFNRADPGLQFVSQHDWIPAFGISWKLGVDGISLFLVALSALIFLLAVHWPRVTENLKTYLAWMLALEAGCIGAFLAQDLFLFFVCFEVVLVPMYFLIGGWGLADRGKAALKFFLYTLAGSAFLFVGMLALVLITAQSAGGDVTFDIAALAAADGVNATEARWLFVAFAIAFAVKIPIFPVHTWLPLTYSQAPIAGLVVSSAVMVKLGTYGLIRFAVSLFPEAAAEIGPWMLTLAVIGMVYGAIVAAMQNDLRRLLAYSSLSHLGFVVMGTFAFSPEALTGAVLQMINHGITAAALFFLLGMVIQRYGSSDVTVLKGIQKLTPVLAGFFTVAVMSSVGVPGLNGFVGEFLILSGTFVTNRWWAVVGTATIVLAAIYLLWAYQRGFHGEPSIAVSERPKDLGRGEKLVLAPLMFLIVFLGVYPQPVLDRIEPTVDRILEQTPDYVATEDSTQPASAELPVLEGQP